jgi:riboflavin synthase
MVAAMFTGIIEETGRVEHFTPHRTGWRLRVSARTALAELALGDSIAVNGCCLTVVAFDATGLEFDVLEEERRVTSLASAAAGATVNLERALRFGGKLGGHFVTGHVDATGPIECFEPLGADHYLRVRAPAGTGRYLIHKGSIALDGISLTVAEVSEDSFAVWLIPHTLAVTNLHTRKVGDRLNLEFDLLGKYVEKLASAATLAARASA